MKLPLRPTGITNPRSARWADQVAFELFEIHQSHKLWEESLAHRDNFKAAERSKTELDLLLANAPPELADWAARAGYVAGLMANEMSQYRESAA